MPIYEYLCQSCHYQEDMLQKINDAPLLMCPRCDKESFQKQISKPAGFDLKGQGWYVTDFKNADKKNAATSEPSVSKTSD